MPDEAVPTPTTRENEPRAKTDCGASVPASIAYHAAMTPQRIAVVDASTRLSFAELERLSNRLAAHLQSRGVGLECCVGLFLERSTEFVVAALAVLKAGAAYLPLDASTPPDRAAFILSDAGATALIAHRGKASALTPGAWHLIDLDGPEQTRIAAGPDGPTLIEFSGESLAYVIYTSGSSGRPKGVEISHANLGNLIEWHRQEFRVSPADRASQVAGLGFDAAAWEIWPHLSAGASLHITDDLTRRSPQALRDWIVSERITIGFVPTILAEPMLRTPWPAATVLRLLLTGAETLHRRPVSGLPFMVVNNYGPTECTVVATSGVVTPDDGDAAISIGRPIRNTSALILDDVLNPVPHGAIGELCLAGAGVGRGYRNNPGLTAERFLTYLDGSGDSLRLYRTGDRARLMPNGEIAFLGRLDDQVKVRGHRIEPAEIVAWLDQYPGVEASAVALRDADSDIAKSSCEPFLAAYVVVARDADLTASALREFLASRLPDYMVPPCYVAIAALPISANGKLDRSALPAPCAENLVPERIPEAEGLAADLRSGLEQRLAELVSTLLGHASIDREDNLFMAGGHSLLGAQLLTRIKDTFGVKLSLRQLFNAPTVATLTVEVACMAESAGLGS